MRPKGRGETDSLYFQYPHFDAPSERASLGNSSPVAIVGAGPVGMVAALALAKDGVASVLFDAKDTFNDGSRAICIARQSFQILEQLGAIAPFLDKALGWTTGCTFYRGQQILEFEMPDHEGEKYRPMYNLQQQYIEQYLWDAIRREPLIETRWQSSIEAVEDIEDGVALTIKDPAGEYEFTASWVLAADGARSTIRRARGLRLQGENYEGRYVIADVQMKHDYPTIRRALFDPDCRRGGTILIHKQPDDIWRIDYQLGDHEGEAEAIKEETVRQTVAAVLEEIGHEGPWELEWWSIYSANTLALDDYRDGRIFFVGDSAHIVPIFGVRGLNNGIADAHNIAWKLAGVLRGTYPEAILESYTPERRGATLDVFANASKSARFMTPPKGGWQLMRDAALNLALSHPFAGALANPRQMTPYTYADSPIVSPDDSAFSCGPVPGATLPNARFKNGYLTDVLGAGFSLITTDAKLAKSIKAENLTVIVIEHGSDACEILGAGPNSAYLVRPDYHIAARWFDASSDAVKSALTRAQGGDAQ